MSRVVGLWLGMVAGCVSMLTSGCGSEPVAGPADEGSAEIWMSDVPTGVKCIHIQVAAGGAAVSKNFPVTPGTMPVLSLGRLPVGPASFAGSAFTKSCPGDDTPPTGAPRWLAEPVLAELYAGGSTTVELDFWRNNPVDGTAEFHESAVAVAHAGDNTYALGADGTLYGWGYGSNGQLGGGVATAHVNRPQVVPGISDPDGVGGGTEHTCAWKGPDVWCWGENRSGQLGLGVTDLLVHPPTLIARPWTDDVLEVEGGDSHTCALTAAHELYCWGENSSGQLGVGDTVNRATPTLVQYFSDDFIALGAGENHTCAVMQDRSVTCWGDNVLEQLGTIDPAALVLSPRYVRGSNAALDVVAGWAHSCLLRADGSVRCWGQNYDGQLGTGDQVNLTAAGPVVVGLTGAVGLVAGFDHTCAARRDGDVVCWGYNGSGQLGDGTGVSSPVPVAVLELDEVASISGTFDGSCALRASGEVRCWGYNSHGQVGDGTFIDAFVPSHVELLP